MRILKRASESIDIAININCKKRARKKIIGKKEKENKHKNRTIKRLKRLKKGQEIQKRKKVKRRKKV